MKHGTLANPVRLAQLVDDCTDLFPRVMSASEYLPPPSSFDEITLASIEAAREIIQKRLPLPTPTIRWPLLEENVSGAELWVKHENHLPTGAFKVRGGVRYFDWLKNAHPEVSGVIAATRGNHGQSVALAAKSCGLQVVIVVPEGNSVDKNRAMMGYGAELMEHGADFNEALAFAADFAEREGLHMVPSFDWALVEGVASYGLELFRQAPDLDRLYVPIGLGSGICGCLAARRVLGLERRTEIVGVVAAAAPCYQLSFDAGRAVTTEGVSLTIADGVACRVPNEEALTVIRDGVSRILSLSEGEIAMSMSRIVRDVHQIAEGAGALSIAAAIHDAESDPDWFRGKRIGAVLTGGNVDGDVLRRVIDHQLSL
jgi:threonine dehydratase